MAYQLHSNILSFFPYLSEESGYKQQQNTQKYAANPKATTAPLFYYEKTVFSAKCSLLTECIYVL